MSFVTIPERIVDFVNGATIAVVGTRSADFVPHVHRPSGFSVSDDGRSVVCLFSAAFSEHLESSLADNGEIAFTVSEAPSHETYQLKGRFLDSGPVSEEDFRVYESCRERAVERLCSLFGFPEQALRENFLPPTLSVRFEVREIFDQTPGPQAGRRLFPSDEA